jgi:hypothetical protein
MGRKSVYLLQYGPMFFFVFLADKEAEFTSQQEGKIHSATPPVLALTPSVKEH